MSNSAVQVFPEIGKGLGAATALLAAIGVGSGVALRMLRNYPLLMMAFVVVLVVATLATMLSENRYVRIVGFTGFVIALGVLTWVAGEASQAKDRPLIIASSETTGGGLTKVTTEIKADGLTMKELIYVAYRATRRVPVNSITGKADNTTNPRSLLGQAAFGPNSDGSVEGKFTFEVSPALYWDVAVTASRHRGLVDVSAAEECIPLSTREAKGRDWSCARFILPIAPLRPQVSASISVGAGERVITANVAAGGVAPSRAIVLKGWAGTKRLFDQVLGPDLSGAVKATLTTSMGSAGSQACIVAALVPSAVHRTAADVKRSLCEETAVLPETAAKSVVQSY
jgi:hypothetical protein